MNMNEHKSENREKKEVADSLAKLLADTAVLYLKTHGFHWNVTGANFFSLHLSFEKQYQELFEALDEIAERIRALNYYVPASYAEYLKHTSIHEEKGYLKAHEMVQSLTTSHQQILKTIHHALEKAKAAEDEGTIDLLVDRLKAHEKMAWMLRSHLNEV